MFFKRGPLTDEQRARSELYAALVIPCTLVIVALLFSLGAWPDMPSSLRGTVELPVGAR